MKVLLMLACGIVGGLMMGSTGGFLIGVIIGFLIAAVAEGEKGAK